MNNRPQTVKDITGSQTQHLETVGKPDRFVSLYKMDFANKIRVIRSGIPAQRVAELSAAMAMPRAVLMNVLGLSSASIRRKAQRGQLLSPDESERVMGMEALIGRAEAMLDADYTPAFNAARWLASWLSAPLPALGGATPGSFMDTVEGQKHIGNLLEMARSGAYA